MPSAPPVSPPVLEVKGLCKSFHSRGLWGKRRSVVAAREVGFRLEPGRALALVGESGSGKSTIAKLLLRLEEADAGEIRLGGRDVLREERGGATLAYRGQVQMVFQDPFGSLNPVHSVAYHLQRPLLRHGRCRAGEARDRALALLEDVGLRPAADFIDRHPYELSGGQRQRVAIARALAVEPTVLVADEPTSMLDVSIRTDILNLLLKLKRERGLAILLITHDLASARYLADRILVLYRGRVVEDGAAGEVVASPAHPYTRQLLAAIQALPHGEAPGAAMVQGTVPEQGCPFAPRCPEVHELCHQRDPAPREHEGRQLRCHLYPAAGAARG